MFVLSLMDKTIWEKTELLQELRQVKHVVKLNDHPLRAIQRRKTLQVVTDC